MTGDVATASAFVRRPPEDCFRLLTEQIDQWWRRTPAHRHAPARSVVLLEAGVGGRLYERFDADDGARVIVTGTVLVWEPPERLVLRWRNVTFREDQATEVDVRFVACPGGTRVTVEHRGWSTLPPDAPVRHGQPPAEFLARLGLWWGGQLTALRDVAASGGAAGGPEGPVAGRQTT